MLDKEEKHSNLGNIYTYLFEDFEPIMLVAGLARRGGGGRGLEPRIVWDWQESVLPK